MSEFAYTNPRDFFMIFDKSSPLYIVGDTSFQHPMLYFEGETYLYLYKHINGITYTTRLEKDMNGGVPFPNTSQIADTAGDVSNNIPVETAMSRLLKEYSAKEILKPLDWEIILAEHVHDAHQHANVGINDIQL